MLNIDAVDVNKCYRNKYEVAVAKLFILFLSVKMFSPLYFISSWTYGLADVSSFLFLVLGLVGIFFRGKIIIPNDQGTIVFKRFIVMFIICDITSIIMAILLYNEAGVIAGERTLGAASKKILFTLGVRTKTWT